MPPNGCADFRMLPSCRFRKLFPERCEEFKQRQQQEHKGQQSDVQAAVGLPDC